MQCEIAALETSVGVYKTEEVHGASIRDNLSSFMDEAAHNKLNRILHSMSNSVVAEKIVNPEPNTSTCCTL